jgi:hypothetical protein
MLCNRRAAFEIDREEGADTRRSLVRTAFHWLGHRKGIR